MEVDDIPVNRAPFDGQQLIDLVSDQEEEVVEDEEEIAEKKDVQYLEFLEYLEVINPKSYAEKLEEQRQGQGTNATSESDLQTNGNKISPSVKKRAQFTTLRPVERPSSNRSSSSSSSSSSSCESSYSSRPASIPTSSPSLNPSVTTSPSDGYVKKIHLQQLELLFSDKVSDKRRDEFIKKWASIGIRCETLCAVSKYGPKIVRNLDKHYLDILAKVSEEDEQMITILLDDLDMSLRNAIKEEKAFSRASPEDKQEIKRLSEEYDRCLKKIKKLDEMPVEWAEMDKAPNSSSSVYLKRYNLIVKVKELCKSIRQLQSLDHKTGTKLEDRMVYKGTQFHGVNEKMTQFLNGKDFQEKGYGIPHFVDIKEVIKGECSSLGIGDEEVDTLSRHIAKDVGTEFQRRRQTDLYYDMSFYDYSSKESRTGPTLPDEALVKRLEENDIKGKLSMNEVFGKFETMARDSMPDEESVDAEAIGEDEEEEDVEYEEEEREEVDNVPSEVFSRSRSPSDREGVEVNPESENSIKRSHSPSQAIYGNKIPNLEESCPETPLVTRPSDATDRDFDSGDYDDVICLN